MSFSLRKFVLQIFPVLILCGGGRLLSQELIRNPSFRQLRNLPQGQLEALKKSGICLEMERFPQSWILVPVQNARARVEYVEKSSGLKFQMPGGARPLLLAGHFYRRQRGLLDGAPCRWILMASGEGSITAGFYCYEKNGRFAGTVKNRPLKVAGTTPMKFKVDFMAEKFLPESADQLTPLIEVSGNVILHQVSLHQLSLDEQNQKLVLPGDFAKLSVNDRIARIGQSGDYQLPLNALLDSSQLVRIRACHRLACLGRRASPAASKLAERLLNDSAEPVRVHAAFALMEMLPDTTLLIQNLLTGSNRTASLTLATTLRNRKGGVPSELQQYVEWANPPVALEGDSLLPDGGFEGGDSQRLIGWSVEFKDGAAGYWDVEKARAYEGRRCLKIVKTNGVGYIQVSSTLPVTVPSADSLKSGNSPWTYRFFFHAENAGYNSLLMPKFITETGDLRGDESSVNFGAGWQSQTLLRNTPGHVWERRLIMVRPSSAPQKLRPAIVFYGNPATVYIDKAEFPAFPRKMHASGPSLTPRQYSLKESLDIISARPEAKIEIRQTKNHRVNLLLNGKQTAPVLFLSINSSTADYDFVCGKGGVKLPVVMLNLAGNLRYPPYQPSWDGRNAPDYEFWFQKIESALCKSPRSSFILGFNVEFPRDFVMRNPDEAWVDENGRKGYGSPLHFKGFTESLPTSGNDMFWPSQYSEKAWNAVGRIFRDFLRELKKKPYAGIFAGTFICGGHDGQFMIHRKDFSRPAVRAWQNFLRERYGTDRKLAEAWNDDKIVFRAAKIPGEVTGKGQNPVFYDPAFCQSQADYQLFVETQIWKNAEFFAKIFKEEMGKNKMAMTWCMGGGWQKNFRYFMHSVFDCFVAQPAYDRRLGGLSGGLNMPSDSFALHGKIVIDELDSRNWMRGIYNELQTMRIGTPLSREEFQTWIMKEVGRMIANYQGYWHYSISGNEFRHPDAAEVIRKARETADWVAERAEKDVFHPGAVLVFHQESLYTDRRFLTFRGNFPRMMSDEMMYALRRSGVPMAGYFLDDLMTGENWKKYRIFIFVNAFRLNEQERIFIQEKLKRNGNILVWIYAPGIMDKHGICPEKVGSLCGMKLTYQSEPAGCRVLRTDVADSLNRNLPCNMGVADNYRRRLEMTSSDRSEFHVPLFRITDPEAVILGRFNDRSGALGVRRFGRWTSVFCAAPGGLDAELLFNLSREAGIYCAADRPGLICQVNGFFVSLHACVGGTYRIQLPRRCKSVTDVMSGKKIRCSDGKYLDVTLQAWESLWLKLTD